MKIIQMLLLKKNLFSPFILLLIIGLYSCGTKKENAEIAKFDGGIVTQNEYVAKYLSYSKNKPTDVPTIENLKEIVWDIALNRITPWEAENESVVEDSAYQNAIKLAENKILYQAYMTRLTRSIITDSLIQKYYSSFSPQYKMKYILRVANDEVSAKFKKQSKDTINWIYKKLKNGADFEELAEKYSHDARTSKKGGSLGFVIAESFGDKELRKKMTEMRLNSFSKPIKGLAGYYILYKGEVRAVPVPPFEEIKIKIVRSLNHTRKHEIEKIVTADIAEYEKKLNYKTNENGLTDIKKIAGWNKKMTDSDELFFNRIIGNDLAKIIAQYDGGVIRTFELFPPKDKRPKDEWEFMANYQAIKKVHLLAQKARYLGFLEFPEVIPKVVSAKKTISSRILYEINVQRKVEKTIDSLKTNSNLDPAQLRSKSGELFSTANNRYEADIKEKYKFEYVAENYETALQEAAREKNLIKKRSKK